MTRLQISSVAMLCALLLTSLFAGCATVTDDAADQLGDDAGGEDGQDGASAPQGPTSEAEARATYRSALQGLTPGKDDPNVTPPDRFGLSVEISGLDAGEGALGDMSFFIDTPANIMIMSMSGQAFQNETPTGGGMAAGMGGMMGEGGFLMAQYHKTTFFGSTDSLISMYNESAEPVEDWNDLQEEAGPAPSSEDEEDAGIDDPLKILEELDDPPEDAELTYETTTYNGEPALEIHLSYDNATETVDMTAILLLDPPFEGADEPLPVKIELTFTDKNTTGDDLSQGKLLYTFTYADQATHDLLEPLGRAESLTFTDVEAVDSAFGMSSGEDVANKTWTIQPARNSGTVPLSEVEARLNGQASEEETFLTVPLEEGTGETQDLRLTYTDADGDGHVSEGDTIRVEELSNGTSPYSLVLYDEETGLSVTPGLGLWAALAAVGLSAVAVGRRR